MMVAASVLYLGYVKAFFKAGSEVNAMVMQLHIEHFMNALEMTETIFVKDDILTNYNSVRIIYICHE
jgi:hypothetical protein